MTLGFLKFESVMGTREPQILPLCPGLTRASMQRFDED
jgi:hypothetical protein